MVLRARNSLSQLATRYANYASVQYWLPILYLTLETTPFYCAKYTPVKHVPPPTHITLLKYEYIYH
jgi:hypothetical protein